MRPIQAYLDSSDFSRFGDVLSGRGTPEHREVLEALEHLIDAGVVECRYSYIHIVEAAPTSDEALPRACERALAIERLCGKRTLTPFMCLPIVETMGAIQDQSISTVPRDRIEFHGRNDMGQWFPSFDSTLGEMAGMISAASKDVVGAAMAGDPDFAPNRAARRMMKKKGKPHLVKKALEEMLPSIWAEHEMRLRSQFPLSESGSKKWLQFILGDISLSEVSKATATDLGNLVEVMKWMAPSSPGHLKEAAQWLRQMGERFIREYADGRKAMLELELEQRTSMILDEEERRKLWEQGASTRESSFRTRFTEAAIDSLDHYQADVQLLGSDSDELIDLVRKHGLSVLPSQQTMVALLMGNFQKNVAPFEQKRKVEKVGSDPGDMMHGCYMPYVDIMRVDGFAFQYMQPAARLSETVLVDKLEKLLPAIKSLAQQRDQYA